MNSGNASEGGAEAGLTGKAAGVPLQVQRSITSCVIRFRSFSLKGTAVMSKFGWSYPPGCSGPPEPPDPHPKSDEMFELLDAAGVSQDVIVKACAIVDELAGELEAECPSCLQRMADEERRTMKEFEAEF